MNGVSRFLSKRERKPKGGSSAESTAKCGTQCPELCKVFTPADSKKKTDKEEEKKVKAITQRLTQLGIVNLKEAQIEYALRTKTTNGDVDKAADLLHVFEDSVDGIVREYRPTLQLLGAENREAVTCYLDALLFAMFAKLDSFEALLFDTFTETPRKNLASLLRLWVNMLRSGKLITTDIVKHIQDALAECGWPEAAQLKQQDTSEAFTFITDKLQLPLLTLKMDIYHFGKEDIKDDHRVVHERLLDVAIPEKENGTVTLEECLENYFNNRIEVKRHLQRRNTLQSLRSYSAAKSEVLHIETTEIEPSPSSSRPTSPAKEPITESPISKTSTSSTLPPPAFLSGRLRTDSIFSEKRVPVQDEQNRTQDDASLPRGRPRAGTIRREVLMPAWQFFSLIPWYTDDTSNSTSETNEDAQVAAHFSKKRPVLGICLKRYQMQANGRSKRLGTHVDIPLEIALPEFVSDEHKYEDFGDFKLSLESVVCHRGVSTQAGHYISLVRGVPPKSADTDQPASEDGRPVATPWMRFDDLAAERVTMVDIDKALKEESPYLLFYQVQPIDEDLPPSYAEAQQDSPPQHPIGGDGHLTEGSEVDLIDSTIMSGGNGDLPTVSSEEPLAPLANPSVDNLQASGEIGKLPFGVNRSDSKLSSTPLLGSAINSTGFAANATGIIPAASQSDNELLTNVEKGRNSLEVQRRRASVAFDNASLTTANTEALTPSMDSSNSANASVTTPSTAPATPVEEGGKSWLPSITGSRRNSRSEKGRSSDKQKEKRPPSQSGEGRLSLTMSRLSGKMSKDKLLSNLMSSTNNAIPAPANEEEPMVTVTEVQTNKRPSVVPEDNSRDAMSVAKPRASFDLLTPKPAMPSSTPAGGTVGRSRSLRHKHKLVFGGSKDEEKRSRSHGREVQEMLSAAEKQALGRSSVELDGHAMRGDISGASGGNSHTGSLRKKKGVAHAHGAERPDRECVVM